jgi:hypothetical protein
MLAEAVPVCQCGEIAWDVLTTLVSRSVDPTLPRDGTDLIDTVTRDGQRRPDATA